MGTPRAPAWEGDGRRRRSVPLPAPWCTTLVPDILCFNFRRKGTFHEYYTTASIAKNGRKLQQTTYSDRGHPQIWQARNSRESAPSWKKVHRLHSQSGAPVSSLAAASTEPRGRFAAGSVRGARKRSMPPLLLPPPPLARLLPASQPAALAAEEHEQVQEAGVADASAAVVALR